MEHRHFKVGPINYFGYGGLPVDKVRAAFPLHTGDTVSFSTLPMDKLRQSVQEAIGSAPTDVAIVCCDKEQRLLLFVGLAGTTFRSLRNTPVPKGAIRLDAQGLKLYNDDIAALQQAMVHGLSEEDDSQGYTISAYPPMKAVNLAMRSYALDRQKELIDVLQHAGDPEQRTAAAQLLGYAKRSPAQVEALSKAIADPNEEVRNNATRALEVLATSKGEPLAVDAQALIALLFSGKWTDRNKASLLLLHLTETDNVAILQALHRQAIEPLVEGASWTGDPGHSEAFFLLLGRIAGIPKAKLYDMLKREDVAAVVAAARAANL